MSTSCVGKWRNINNIPKIKIKNKTSYGIACCRWHEHNGIVEPKVLMIRKRYTYAFNEFVCGHYDIDSDADIRELFCNMTMEEKNDISRCDFDVLWARLWNGKTPRGFTPDFARRKFTRAFLETEDKRHRLLMLINNTPNSNPIWEIPKGRKTAKESAISCATREFGEETGVPRQKYTILISDRNLQHTHTDNNVRYVYNYFLAHSWYTDEYDPNVFNIDSLEQHLEIAEVRWMSKKEIDEVDSLNHVRRLADQIFKEYKRIVPYVRD